MYMLDKSSQSIKQLQLQNRIDLLVSYFPGLFCCYYVHKKVKAGIIKGLSPFESIPVVGCSRFRPVRPYQQLRPPAGLAHPSTSYTVIYNSLSISTADFRAFCQCGKCLCEATKLCVLGAMCKHGRCASAESVHACAITFLVSQANRLLTGCEAHHWSIHANFQYSFQQLCKMQFLQPEMEIDYINGCY